MSVLANGHLKTLYSVIISVYLGDNVNWFEIALNSIINQSIEPDQIVITIDGYITDEHQAVIRNLENRNPKIRFTRIISKKLAGRGKLLARAVLAAENELVAIMDADDISKNDRFETQLLVFKDKPNIDLVGSWVAEIENQNVKTGIRKVPEIHSDIFNFLPWRNPFNQMTVMFKRSAVLSAGNYQEHMYFEDMWLWIRMLKNGATAYNIPRCLVVARAGRSMINRRSGLKYMASEFSMYKRAYRSNYFGLLPTITCILIRLPLRLLPTKYLSAFYNRFLRNFN